MQMGAEPGYVCDKTKKAHRDMPAYVSIGQARKRKRVPGQGKHWVIPEQGQLLSGLAARGTIKTANPQPGERTSRRGSVQSALGSARSRLPDSCSRRSEVSLAMASGTSVRLLPASDNSCRPQTGQGRS